MVYEVYARHGGRYKSEAESVDAAIESLAYGNESGDFFPVAAYDVDANELYVSDVKPADVRRDFELEFVREVCGLPADHAFAAMHERRFFWDDGG